MCVRFTERARQRALCLFALSFARERERGCAGCVKREREREREKKERGSRSRKKSRDGNFFLSSLFVVDVDAGPPLRVFHAPEVHSRACPLLRVVPRDVATVRYSPQSSTVTQRKRFERFWGVGTMGEKWGKREERRRRSLSNSLDSSSDSLLPLTHSELLSARPSFSFPRFAPCCAAREDEDSAND